MGITPWEHLYRQIRGMLGSVKEGMRSQIREADFPSHLLINCSNSKLRVHMEWKICFVLKLGKTFHFSSSADSDWPGSTGKQIWMLWQFWILNEVTCGEIPKGSWNDFLDWIGWNQCTSPSLSCPPQCSLPNWPASQSSSIFSSFPSFDCYDCPCMSSLYLRS